MTPEERAAVREQVARSRAAQGLPRHIEDEGFLRELAASIVDRHRQRQGAGDGRGKEGRIVSGKDQERQSELDLDDPEVAAWIERTAAELRRTLEENPAILQKIITLAFEGLPTPRSEDEGGSDDDAGG